MKEGDVSGSRGTWRYLIAVGAVILVVAAVYWYRNCAVAPEQPIENAGPVQSNVGRVEQPLPRLVDIGSDICVPCKMMMPVLDELEEELAGRLEVVFINVRKELEAAREYDINIIPTQIF